MVSSEDAENQLPYMQRRINDAETLSLITTKTSDTDETDTFVMLRSVLVEKSEN